MEVRKMYAHIYGDDWLEHTQGHFASVKSLDHLFEIEKLIPNLHAVTHIHVSELGHH